MPLVLAAAACDERVEDLPFLEAPAPHAVARSLEELEALGALTENGTITGEGRLLYGLPLDAHLGRLLVEGRARDSEMPGILEEMVDLVSGLAPGRTDLPALREAALGPRLRAQLPHATPWLSFGVSAG